MLRAKCVLGTGVREERVISAKMQQLKKQMLRKGVTDESLYELDQLRIAAMEAESGRKERRRQKAKARNTTSKLKRRALADGDDEPPAPPITRRPVQAEFDLGDQEEKE